MLSSRALVDVDDAVLEGGGEYEQLFEERLVSERNANVGHVGLAYVIADRSVLCVVVA